MKQVMNPINTPTQRFKDGNPATGEYGTIVTAEFLNNVQDSVINTQQELHSVLAEAGIEANDEQVNQVAKAIKKIAGDATRDNFNALANPDGYKHIGRCKSVAELRTIRPTEHGQRILVDAYYEDGTTGGGEFVADLQDLVTPDDGGVCFVVNNNGGRWKRVDLSHLTLFDFWAVGDG
ncbi:TPA: phage tail protein, partial [Mannheimia haemolytica]|nr:phage tail protein [Mannheimia haemolytica]HDL4397324.1 phage tail protein [Mannheimia haemolytica]